MAPSTTLTGPSDFAGRRRPGVGLDDGAVFGDVAQDAGPQRGDGQAQLQAGPADQGRIDRLDPVGPLVEGGGQWLEVEHRAAARAQATAHPGQAQSGPGQQAEEVALAAAPGPAGRAPRLAVRRGGGHQPVAGQRHGRAEREGRPGPLGDLLLDLAAQPGPLQGVQPLLLAEHALGAGHGEDVALDLVDPPGELVERAGLGQHGGGDGAGRGGGHDLGDDALDTRSGTGGRPPRRIPWCPRRPGRTRSGRGEGGSTSARFSHRDSRVTKILTPRRRPSRPRPATPAGPACWPTPNAGRRSGRRRRRRPWDRPPRSARPPGRRWCCRPPARASRR